MARSALTDIKTDLISDSGAVLWSFVQGEQVEFPVTLNFLTNAGLGYIYEAVIIEGLNVSGSLDTPELARPSGVSNSLVVRVPLERGVWNPDTDYNREDVVSYGARYYKLKTGLSYLSSTPPSDDTAFWEEHSPNQVYLQFPGTLTLAWTVQPTITAPVYGFFELRVTEPAGSIYPRTWKPMRGLVQYLYSPTQIVPD